MEGQHQTRPPQGPKPSRNQAGEERQKQLKDRLRLRWDNPQPLYAHARLGPAPTIDCTVKGYGEAQFGDSLFEPEPRLDLEQASESLWMDSAVLPPNAKQSITPRSTGVNPTPPFRQMSGLSTRFNDSTMSAGSQAMMHQSIHQRTMQQSTLQQDTVKLKSSLSVAKGNASLLMSDSMDFSPRFAPVPHSHLEVSQSLTHKGLDAVAESLVFGQTGFCYVENKADDFYQFSVRSDVPESLGQSTYMTLSEHGVMRSVPGGEEITSFANLDKEIKVYRQLMQLSIFKRYRLWKPFLVWRRHVRGKKFDAMKKALIEKLLSVDEFNRKLMFAARKICLEINSFTIFTVDHRDFSKSGVHNNIIEFSKYVELQKKNNTMIVEKIRQIKERLVDLLASRCEVHICNATLSAPASLSHEKYNTIKLSAANNYQQIVSAAQDNHAILQASMNATTVAPRSDLLEALSAIESTMDSMSTVSNYIYNTANISSMGNQVYSVKYTQELLDDQSIISAYGQNRAPVADTAATISKSTEKSKTKSTKKSKTANSDVNGGGSVSSEHPVPMGPILNTDAADGAPVATPAPTHVSYSVRAAIRLVCRRIYHMFRIIDYMLRDLFYDKLNEELLLVNSLLANAFEHYDGQVNSIQVVTNIDTNTCDKAIPIVEGDPVPSVGYSLKKDIARNMKSKLESLFFVITISITDFDYNSGQAKGAALIPGRATMAVHQALPLAVSNKLMIAQENVAKITVSLSPTADLCIDEFVLVLRQTCEMCRHTEGLLFNQRCLDVLKPVLHEVVVGPLEDRIFNESDNFSYIQLLVNSCIAYLQKSFHVVSWFTNFLFSHKKEYSGNIKKLLVLEANKLANATSDSIMHDFTMWDGRLVKYNSLFAQYNIGVFYLNMRAFRSNLIANVSYCIQSYNKYVPELYIRSGDAFYKDISRYMAQLGKIFHNIDEYIKNVEVFNLVTKKQEEISEAFAYVAKLKDIIDLRGIRVSDEVMKQHIILASIYTKLNLLLSNFSEGFEGQVKLYRTEIINRLKNTMVPIQELQDYLIALNTKIQSTFGGEGSAQMHPRHMDRGDSSLSSYDGDDSGGMNVDSILRRLLRYKVDINLISNQLQTLDYYQQLLGLSVFEYNVQLEIQKELNANIQLFSSFTVISKLHSTFMSTNYIDINHSSISKEIRLIKQELEDSEYFIALKELIGNQSQASASTIGEGKSAHHMHNSTEDSILGSVTNQGVYILYEKIFAIVKEFDLYIPIVNILQSKALTADHHSKINHLVNYNIFDMHDGHVDHTIHSDSDYTVHKLIETVQIRNYVKELQVIFNEAIVTCNLETKLATLLQQIHCLEFSLSSESETANKSHVYILNYHTLMEDLQDFHLSLTSLLSSSYSHRIVSKHPTLLEDVKDYMIYLEHFNTIQLAHNKYKLLFISARSARHLSVYMRNYKVVDDTYRILIKTAKMDKFIQVFVNDKNTKGYILQCLEHINTIDKGFLQILQDFCEKYPKLYLVNENIFFQTFLLTNLKDIVMLVTPYIFQAMNITNVEYDINDESNVLSVTSSYYEKLTFHKACSARNNIHDFLKMMDGCIHDKYERDIKDLIYAYVEEDRSMSLIDEIKNNNNKYTAQALLLMYQIQFWNNFWRLFITPQNMHVNMPTASATPNALMIKSGYSRSAQAKMKAFMLELQDSINILYTIYTEPISQYGIQLTSNIIITLLYYRDLLKNILEEYNLSWDHELNINKDIHKVVGGISLIYCNMQKYIEFYPNNVNCFNIGQHIQLAGSPTPLSNAHSNTNANSIINNIYIAIGGEKIKYGLKYHGFIERLVIHPIVDKFNFSMVQCLQSHSVAYVSNPVTTTSTCSVGSVDMLNMLSCELGTEQIVYHVKNISLYAHNTHFYQAVNTEGGEQHLNNMTQLNRIIRAAMKSGLWITMVNDDSTNDRALNTSIMSYIASALSIIYSELHNKNCQHSIPNYVNNVDDYNNNFRSAKYELFNNISIDHFSLNQMKFIIMNNNMSNHHMFNAAIHSQHHFRPLTLPTVNVKIILNILLASYNFIYINKLSERLEQLISFLIHHNYGSYHLLKYLLIQTIRTIGNHNDHLLINVSMQLSLIVKKFLNNLPNVLLSKILENNHMAIIYNLFLEMVYDPAKDEKDMYTAGYHDHMTHEQELVARLWDSTSTGSHGYNVQLHNNVINSNIFHNDIDSVATYNKLPPVPEATAMFANASNIGTHAIYKRNIMVLGNIGVGKTELIFRSLYTLRAKYHIEDRPNIRILPFVINPCLIAGSSREVPGTMPTTVDREMAEIQKYLQNFLNLDHAMHILNIICFDVTGYGENVRLLQQIVHYINTFYRLLRIKLVFESVNVVDLDPGFLTQFDIIHIEKPLFTVDQLIEKHLAQCVDGESGTFKKVMEECAAMLIKPAVQHILAKLQGDKVMDTALRVVPQLFSLVTSLYYQFIYPETQFGQLSLNPTAAPPQHTASRFSVAPPPRRALSAMNINTSLVPPLPAGNLMLGNKQYKLPVASCDEDSLRRIVVYSIIWVCGAHNHHASISGHGSLEVYHKNFETYIRQSLQSTNTGLKKIFPHEHCSIFCQYLYPRIQAAGISHGANAANSSPVLEWTVIDQKHIHTLIYNQSRSKDIDVNSLLLYSTSLFPHDNFHKLYMQNSLSVNLSFIQNSYTHVLPIHLQSTSQKQANTLFNHQFNNMHNIFSSKGVLLMGEGGSGKKTLLKQLLHNLLYNHHPNDHWAGLTNVGNSNGSDLSSFILEAQRKLAKKRYEQNILNIGAVFLEDLNIDTLHHNHSVNSTLRNLLQFNTVFDSSKHQYKVFNKFFVAATARSVGNNFSGDGQDGRLTRHFHCIDVPSPNMVSVMAAYFERHTSSQYHEICSDLSNVLHYFISNLQQVVSLVAMKSVLVFNYNANAINAAAQATAGSPEPIVGISWGLCSGQASSNTALLVKNICEKHTIGYDNSISLLFPVLRSSASSQCKELINEIIFALYTFNNVMGDAGRASIANINAADILSIFDRILCDYLNRFIHIPYVHDIFNDTLDFTVSHTVPEYKFNNMLGMLEKVRQTRMGNYESIASIHSNNMNVSEPLSYTRNIYGFFKTGSNVFPVLVTAEFVRDVISKKLASHVSTLYVDKGPNAIINLAAIAALASVKSASADEMMLAAYEYSRLYKTSLSFWHDVLRMLTVWTSDFNNPVHNNMLVLNCNINIYNIQSVNHDVRELFHFADMISQVLPRVIVALQYFHNARLELISSEAVGRVTCTNSDVGIDVHHPNFMNCVRKICHFLDDDFVLFHIFSHIQSLTVQTAAGSTVHGKLIAPEVLQYLQQILPTSEMSVLERIQTKYDTISEHTGNKAYDHLHNLQDITVWLIQCELDDFQRMVMDITLQSEYVGKLLRQMNAFLDKDVYGNVSNIIVAYNRRQKYLWINTSIKKIAPSSYAVQNNDGQHVALKNLYASNALDRKDDELGALSRMLQCSVHEYHLNSDYTALNDVMEKLLHSFLVGGRGNSAKSDRELEEQDAVDKERLSRIANIIDEFIEMCYEDVLKHCNYNVQATCASAHYDDEVNPFPYIEGEIRLLFSQHLHCHILQCSSLDADVLKRKLVEICNNYVAYNFQIPFFRSYINELQSVELVLMLSFLSFYHCQLPAKQCAGISKITEFVVSHLPCYHTAGVLQVNPNGSGLAMEHAADHLDGLCILFNNTFYGFNHCSHPVSHAMKMTWAMIYSIPSMRVCKSYLLALYHSIATLKGHVVIRDQTVLSTFLLSHILQLGLDGVASNKMVYNGECLCSEVSNVARTSTIDRTGTNPVSILLSHHEHMQDFMLIYLLEHNLLHSVASELQSLYVQRKEYFHRHILNSSDADATHTPSMMSNLQLMNERFNGLYVEMTHKLARIVENLMLIFTNVLSNCALLHKQCDAVRIVNTLFDEFIRLLSSNIAAAQSMSDSHSFVVEELLCVSLFHLVNSILPPLVPEQVLSNVLLNVVLDYIYLAYYNPSYADTKMLLDQRYKLFVLVKELYSLDYQSEGDNKYTLDRKVGIVVQSKGALASSSLDDSNASSPFSSPVKRKRRTKSVDETSVTSGADSDDQTAETDSGDVIMLSMQSKNTFKHMLLTVANIFPANIGNSLNEDATVIDNFYYKHMHTAHNTTFNLSILDDISEDTDIYVDFATEVYYTGILFPNTTTYHMTILDKLLMCFVLKVNAIPVICRDFIFANGCGIDMTQKRIRQILQHGMTADHNLDIVNIMPPMLPEGRLNRLPSFSVTASDPQSKPVMFNDVYCAKDLLFNIYAHKDLPPSPISASVAFVGIGNIINHNIYICHGLVDFNLIVDYIVQNNRETFLLAPPVNSGPSSSPTRGRTGSMQRMSSANMSAPDDLTDSPGKVNRSPSRLTRGGSFVGGAGGVPTLATVYSRYITTIFFDNSGAIPGQNWISRLIKFISNFKAIYAVHGIVHVVCMHQINPISDWSTLKSFAVKERFNIILTTMNETVQQMSMNVSSGVMATSGKATRVNSMRGLVGNKESDELSVSSRHGGDDSDDESPSHQMSSMAVVLREVATANIFSYSNISLLNVLHMFDAQQIALRIKYYLHYMSQLTYLIDNNASNRFILKWPSYFNPKQQEQLISISKLVINRIRWLLIFLHISIVYYYETVRYSNPSADKYGNILNDSLLYHANSVIEKLWLNTLNGVLCEYFTVNTTMMDNTNAPAESLYSEDPLVNAVVTHCYEQFDEISLHHILLLLVYYPYLQSNVSQNSIIDELHIKYIFENIFTSKSAVHNNSYFILNKLLLPEQINVYKHSDVETFYNSLFNLLTNSDDNDDQESNILMELLFVALPQTATKSVDLQQAAFQISNPYRIGINFNEIHGSLSGATIDASIAVEARGVYMSLHSHSMELLHVKNVLLCLLAALPPEIDVQNDMEIVHTANQFKVNKDMEQMKGRQTMVARPQNISNELGGPKARRKVGQRMLLQFQARDYDSVWTQMLTEAFNYNQQLQLLRRYMEELIWACSSPQHMQRYFHIQRRTESSDDHSLLKELISKLTSGLMPNSLIDFSDGAQQTLPAVTIEQYLYLWSERHKQLLGYLHTGCLNNIKLYLLHNIQGLLFALKESYAMKTESSIDKIFLHYDLCSLSQHSKYVNSIYSANTNTSQGVDSKENLGCNLRAVDLILFQAQLTGKGATADVYSSGANSASLQMDFLPSSAQTSFGTEVVLHIFPSLVEQSINSEVFLCPLFVSSFPAVPGGCPLDGHQVSYSWRDSRQKQALCWVPMNTLEDSAECSLSRIALYTKPAFVVPI